MVELYLCVSQTRRFRQVHAVHLDASHGSGLPQGSGICAWNLCRKWFAVGPYCAVLEILLLPDGHRLFEGIDDPSAGVEGRASMGRSHRNQHTGLADFQPAKAVNDRDIADLEVLDRL